MDIVHTHCAGLDVHKKTVVAAVSVPNPSGGWHQETRTFATMTGDLLALSDWLTQYSVTHVAMESTGEYWKPVFNILETNFEVVLVNAQHIKAVPGRKTDVNDAEWLADLLKHGLVKASFVPPEGQRDLRELTRYRTTFVRERATLVNRVHKVLESANIKLTSVATDVTGASGRAILAEVIQGTASPATMADLAKGRLRAKREIERIPLTGQVAAVSCGIIEGMPVLDLDYAEDSTAETDANFVITSTGGLVEVQGTAERTPFSEAELMALLALARQGVAQLHALQRESLARAGEMR